MCIVMNDNLVVSGSSKTSCNVSEEASCGTSSDIKKSWVPVWRRKMFPPTPARNSDPFELPQDFTPTLKRGRSRTKLSSHSSGAVIRAISSRAQEKQQLLALTRASAKYHSRKDIHTAAQASCPDVKTTRNLVKFAIPHTGDDENDLSCSSKLNIVKDEEFQANTVTTHPIPLPPKKPRLTNTRKSFSDFGLSRKPEMIETAQCAAPPNGTRQPRRLVHSLSSMNLRLTPKREMRERRKFEPEKNITPSHSSSITTKFSASVNNLSGANLVPARRKRVSMSEPPLKKCPEEDSKGTEAISRDRSKDFPNVLSAATSKTNLPAVNIVRACDCGSGATMCQCASDDIASERESLSNVTEVMCSTELLCRCHCSRSPFTMANNLPSETHSGRICQAAGLIHIDSAEAVVPAKVAEIASASIKVLRNNEKVIDKDAHLLSPLESDIASSCADLLSELVSTCACSKIPCSSSQRCTVDNDPSANQTTLSVRSRQTPASSQKSHKFVRFQSVSVYYFARAQGTSTVPKNGEISLGMVDKHFTKRQFPLWYGRRPELALARDSDESLSEGEETGDVFDPEGHERSTAYQLPTLEGKTRIKMLKRSGVQVQKDEHSESLESIRKSRLLCGCHCESGVCKADTCQCAAEDIVCQVDGFDEAGSSHPCPCTSTSCGNPVGRIEFDQAHVKNHCRMTILRTKHAEQMGIYDSPQRIRFTSEGEAESAIQPHASPSKIVVTANEINVPPGNNFLDDPPTRKSAVTPVYKRAKQKRNLALQLRGDCRPKF